MRLKQVGASEGARPCLLRREMAACPRGGGGGASCALQPPDFSALLHFSVLRGVHKAETSRKGREGKGGWLLAGVDPFQS